MNLYKLCIYIQYTSKNIMHLYTKCIYIQYALYTICITYNMYLYKICIDIQYVFIYNMHLYNPVNGMEFISFPVFKQQLSRNYTGPTTTIKFMFWGIFIVNSRIIMSKKL